ncbi:MAG: hypothetical protein HC895_07235 [Leptolyngbyaceae cyanobacterium SM1_3_5]|nr:hypothetical protein [Leptolyngbyaceae cyanobacterium SM1_3_5]
MTDREYSNQWIVVRLMPSFQKIVLGRYRKRSDAQGHLDLMRRRMPKGNFLLVFDAPKLKP